MSSPSSSLLEQFRTLPRRRQAKYAVPSIVLLGWLLSWARRIRRPDVRHADTARNRRIVAMLQTLLARRYVPSIFTPNGHFNSGLGYVKAAPKFSKTRELVRTWDGGNFALDWRDRGPGEPNLPSDAPILLVIHGINGHSEEVYVVNAMAMAHARGWRAAAFNHRGCGGTELSSPWGYNGAFTGDIRLAINNLHHRFPGAPVMAAAYSLGANLLVKYLGEEGRHGCAPLAAAVVVSNPWTLEATHVSGEQAAPHHGPLDWIVGRAYGLLLTLGLRMYVRRHQHLTELIGREDLDMEGALKATQLAHFDKALTVPMWGYEDLTHYHVDASSWRYLADVKVPLMCINAADDPLVPPSMWPPSQTLEANPNVIFVSTKGGGHIGWCQGANPLKGLSWADEVLIEYLAAALETRGAEETAAATTSRL